MSIRLFDFVCLYCASPFEGLVRGDDLTLCWLTGQGPVCPDCGGPTVREIVQMAAVHPDTVPGGFVIENLNRTPTRFDSKSEYARELKRQGKMIGFHHTGTPGEGSDKSKHSQRFI